MAEAQATAPGVDAASWPDFVAGLQLRGPVRELAASSAFIAHGDGVLRLSLPESDDHLRAPFLVRQFADALGATWGSAPDIRFEAGAVASDTLHARNERVRDERQGRALHAQRRQTDEGGGQQEGGRGDADGGREHQPLGFAGRWPEMKSLRPR